MDRSHHHLRLSTTAENGALAHMLGVALVGQFGLGARVEIIVALLPHLACLPFLPTQAMVQLRLVQPPVPVSTGSSTPAALVRAHLGVAAVYERTEIIDHNDRSVGIHPMIMPRTHMVRHPNLPLIVPAPRYGRCRCHLSPGGPSRPVTNPVSGEHVGSNRVR
ncbi:hypothetical protein GKC29_24960 [Micromonospora sp. WMMC415]|uniref:hypothetical protein n=1 Tax=Micromonospora sp. WMMC415 TaxID=2675222 RepID=UPI0012B4E0A4|nr:hypothetical protein [Micromonospora sp. WMMC415]QGN49759.1 hypothetical protein GKC29_24960 [Micromonospora sp. WMMC415]